MTDADRILIAWTVCVLSLVATVYVCWRAHRASPLPRARGRDLDNIALVLGVKRRRVWWIFRESDKALRARTTEVMRNAGPVLTAKRFGR